MALARERSPIPSSERVPGPRLSAAVQELVVTWRGRLPRVSLRALSLLPPTPTPHPVDNLLEKLSGFEIYAFPCPKSPRTAPHAGNLRSPPPAWSLRGVSAPPGPCAPADAPGPPQLWIPGSQVKKPHEEGWKDRPPPRAVLESLQKAVWAKGWHGIPTQKGIFTVGNKNKGGRPPAWALVRKQDFPCPFGNTLPPGWGPASLSPAQEAEPLDSGAAPPWAAE